MEVTEWMNVTNIRKKIYIRKVGEGWYDARESPFTGLNRVDRNDFYPGGFWAMFWN